LDLFVHVFVEVSVSTYLLELDGALRLVVIIGQHFKTFDFEIHEFLLGAFDVIRV
jgi:hypothetical protein